MKHILWLCVVLCSWVYGAEELPSDSDEESLPYNKYCKSFLSEISGDKLTRLTMDYFVKELAAPLPKVKWVNFVCGTRMPEFAMRVYEAIKPVANEWRSLSDANIRNHYQKWFIEGEIDITLYLTRPEPTEELTKLGADRRLQRAIYKLKMYIEKQAGGYEGLHLAMYGRGSGKPVKTNWQAVLELVDPSISEGRATLPVEPSSNNEEKYNACKKWKILRFPNGIRERSNNGDDEWRWCSEDEWREWRAEARNFAETPREKIEQEGMERAYASLVGKENHCKILPAFSELRVCETREDLLRNIYLFIMHTMEGCRRYSFQPLTADEPGITLEYCFPRQEGYYVSLLSYFVCNIEAYSQRAMAAELPPRGGYAANAWLACFLFFDRAKFWQKASHK